MIIKYKVLKIYVECNEACLGYFYMPIATNFLKNYPFSMSYSHHERTHVIYQKGKKVPPLEKNSMRHLMDLLWIVQ